MWKRKQKNQKPNQNKTKKQPSFHNLKLLFKPSGPISASLDAPGSLIFLLESFLTVVEELPMMFLRFDPSQGKENLKKDPGSFSFGHMLSALQNKYKNLLRNNIRENENTVFHAVLCSADLDWTWLPTNIPDTWHQTR